MPYFSLNNINQEQIQLQIPAYVYTHKSTFNNTILNYILVGDQAVKVHMVANYGETNQTHQINNTIKPKTWSPLYSHSSMVQKYILNAQFISIMHTYLWQILHLSPKVTKLPISNLTLPHLGRELKKEKRLTLVGVAPKEEKTLGKCSGLVRSKLRWLWEGGILWLWD